MQITNIFGVQSAQGMAVHRTFSGETAARTRQLRRSLERSYVLTNSMADLQRGSARVMLLTGAVLLGLTGGIGLHHPELLPGLLAILVGLGVLSAALVRKVEADIQHVLAPESEQGAAQNTASGCAVPQTLVQSSSRAPHVQCVSGAEQRVILARATFSSLGRVARQHFSVQETSALNPARLSA